MRAQKYEKWRLTFVTAKTRFELREIQLEQQEAIRFFFEKKTCLLIYLRTLENRWFSSVFLLSQITSWIDCYWCGRDLVFAIPDGGPQCLKIPSEYTGYCDHECGRSRNYSSGLEWKPHLIRSVRFATYFRKPNKQFRGSRSLTEDFRRRWARGKRDISNQRFSKALR